MEVRRFLLLLLISMNLTCWSQPKVNWADSARNKLDKQAFDEAVELYELALSEEPYNPELFSFASKALAQTGNLPKALQYLTKALELGTDYSSIYYDLLLKPLWGYPGFKKLDGQYRPENTLYFFDLVERLLRSDKLVEIENVTIDAGNWLGKLDHYSISDINNRIKVPVVDSMISFPNVELRLRGCRFTGEGKKLKFLHLDKLHLDGASGLFEIKNVNMNYLLIHNSNLEYISIENIRQTGFLQIENTGNEFICKRSSFRPGFGSDEYFIDRYGRITSNILDLKIADHIVFEDCNFHMEDNPAPLILGVLTERFDFLRCNINQPMILEGETDYLNFHSNQFIQYLDLMNFKFPEFNAYIPFSQFKKGFAQIDPSGDIKGDSITDIGDPVFFDQLVSVYKTMYNNYRNRGELVSANSSYVVLKELEIAQLKRAKNKRFSTVLRLKLNQIMGFYTDHGTNPAKAIVVSLYIIIIFAVFYFFFPSEWDHESKSKLMQDYRKLVKKNEHGYFKPFIGLTKGLLISLLNAITLSTNAFITLGFGRIPTKGLARYICVFQGLVGWFLLSLFTVALINQVLL
jgi:hypothetical protein